ncbi:MAG TPA: rhodanese-like domain-containing protein [Methylomirabilota bacterium]|nr:rhodanese-like domain-containing protein [Methylomirabilota bacterium]
MEYELFVTPGLGDNSYLLIAAGEAVVVDPQRDAWRFLAAAEARKLRVRYVLETHVHNDYVSGALELRSAAGAEIAAPARGKYEFPHRAMTEGEEVRIGALRVVAWETPGHTPEHLAWLVYEDGRRDPVAVFGGGSLIVGSAGRTDLLGPGVADELTRAQFRSLRRLAELPRDVQLLPTHGAGSFCTTSVGSMERTSTIGAELRSNPALSTRDEESFVRQQLAGLRAYPAYYAHMAAINRAGPPVLGRLPTVPALGPADVARRLEDGAWLIDARDRRAFAAAHVPGSVNIELDSTFGTYVGWLTPFNARLLLLLPDPVPEALAEAVTQLIRIGYERIVGYAAGGLEAWQSERRAIRSFPTASIDDLCHAYLAGQPIRVLDVRQPVEWEAGYVPGSLRIHLGDLPARLAEIPADREVWTTCASGHRASMAASLLDRVGIPVRLVAAGGVPEWLARCYPRGAGDKG